jgi:type IV secretory pathway TrbD component
MARWERFAPLTGVAAVGLWIVGTFLLEKEDRPEGKDTAAFVDWVNANHSSIVAGAIVFGFGVLFFLWMLGSLRARLFAFEGGVGRLSTIAFGAGVATAISMLFTVLPHAQAAFDRKDTSDTSIDALVHMGDAFFGGVELFAIPLVVATALATLRFGALPRWFAWFSLVLALVLVIVPIGWLGVIVGLPLWTLAASLLLWMRQTDEPIMARPPVAMD